VLILVSYDVPDDRRRARLAQTLKDFGERVQLSVFECTLAAEALDRLRERLATLLDRNEDSLRIYRLCAECRENTEVVGLGRAPEEDPKLYVL
jgi:CRISPR-associated protein Cas2